jgi:hypothetical protein
MKNSVRSSANANRLNNKSLAIALVALAMGMSTSCKSSSSSLKRGAAPIIDQPQKQTLEENQAQMLAESNRLGNLTQDLLKEFRAVPEKNEDLQKSKKDIKTAVVYLGETDADGLSDPSKLVIFLGPDKADAKTALELFVTQKFGKATKKSNPNKPSNDMWEIKVDGKSTTIFVGVGVGASAL